MVNLSVQKPFFCRKKMRTKNLSNFPKIGSLIFHIIFRVPLQQSFT